MSAPGTPVAPYVSRISSRLERDGRLPAHEGTRRDLPSAKKKRRACSLQPAQATRRGSPRRTCKSSTWTDATTSATYNFFSILGDSISSGGRRWLINKSYGGCPADTGWLAVTYNNTEGCSSGYGVVDVASVRFERGCGVPHPLCEPGNVGRLANDDRQRRAGNGDGGLRAVTPGIWPEKPAAQNTPTPATPGVGMVPKLSRERKETCHAIRLRPFARRWLYSARQRRRSWRTTMKRVFAGADSLSILFATAACGGSNSKGASSPATPTMPSWRFARAPRSTLDAPKRRSKMMQLQAGSLMSAASYGASCGDKRASYIERMGTVVEPVGDSPGALVAHGSLTSKWGAPLGGSIFLLPSAQIRENHRRSRIRRRCPR